MRRFQGEFEGEDHPHKEITQAIIGEAVDADFAQLNTQLRFSSFEAGLLINFRQWPLKDGGIRRVIHSRK